MTKENNDVTPYVPDLGIAYPQMPDEPMGSVMINGKETTFMKPKKYEFEMGEDFPFWDRSLNYKLKNWGIYLGIYVLVFIVSPLRFGLKVKGGHILREYKKILKDGALTVSNHVHRWDMLFVLQAIRWRRLFFPVMYHTMECDDRGTVRSTGGIPIPKKLHLLRPFLAAFEKLHKEKKWIHVFPESCNWLYYQPIRPFKKGMFRLAYDNNIPILPIAISWRPAHGFFKLFKKNFPLVTVNIGEPILPNKDASRREEVERLRKLTHERIVALAGITNNIWPAEGD
jgi:1-acyl-sn-glycerol-3-phosphate acyltransferase